MNTNKKTEVSLLGAIAICAIAIILKQLLKIHPYDEVKIKSTIRENIPGL